MKIRHTPLNASIGTFGFRPSSVGTMSREEWEEELEFTAEMLDHPDEHYNPTTRFPLKAGTRIVVCSSGMIPDTDPQPEDLLEILEDIEARAYDFGEDPSLSSDSYIVLDDGSDESLVIGDEPGEIDDDDEYFSVAEVRKKYNADYVLVHM